MKTTNKSTSVRKKIIMLLVVVFTSSLIHLFSVGPEIKWSEELTKTPQTGPEIKWPEELTKTLQMPNGKSFDEHVDSKDSSKDREGKYIKDDGENDGNNDLDEDGISIPTLKYLTALTKNVTRAQQLSQENKFDPTKLCRLFDFALAGFAKCGTTSLRHWLRTHPEVTMPKNEMPYFYKNPISVAKEILKYNNSKKVSTGKTVNRYGYGNPHEIQWKGSLNFFRNTCRTTKIIVSVRHPVLWFESFYNYRVSHEDFWSIPAHPNNVTINKVFFHDKIGCKANYVCAYAGRFHNYLAELGKTSLRSTEELDLLDADSWGQVPSFGQTNFRLKTSSTRKLDNPIFLVEVSQLNDDNSTRRDRLNRDLQKFLGLSRPIPVDVPHANHARKISKGHIDICSPNYQIIRDEMLLIARNASIWIRNYFLQSEDVTVSLPEYVDELLRSWFDDPCKYRKETKQS